MRVGAGYKKVGFDVTVLEDVSSGDGVEVYSVGGVAQGFDIVANAALRGGGRSES